MLQSRERSDVPLATIAPQQIASLFDHLIGTSKQRWRHGEAECLGGLEIDGQLELGGLLDGKFSGPYPLKILSTKLAARKYRSG